MLYVATNVLRSATSIMAFAFCGSTALVNACGNQLRLAGGVIVIDGLPGTRIIIEEPSGGGPLFPCGLSMMNACGPPVATHGRVKPHGLTPLGAAKFWSEVNVAGWLVVSPPEISCC